MKSLAGNGITRAGCGRTHAHTLFFIIIIYYGHARTAHGRRELIARRGQDGTGQTNDGREH